MGMIMSSKEVPFEPEEICDCCGKKGAYDFMGDILCSDCDDALLSAMCPECHSANTKPSPIPGGADRTCNECGTNWDIFQDGPGCIS